MAIPTVPAATRSQIGDFAQPYDLWNYRPQGETPGQRLDRLYAELLQEVRVAQTGVQVLLAFLLWVALNPPPAVSAYHRVLYVVALIFACLALALLIAPACASRIGHQRSVREVALQFGIRCAIGGIALLFLSLSCSIFIIFDILLLGSMLASTLGLAVVMWFLVWWYIVPLIIRRRHARRARPVAVPTRQVDLPAPPWDGPRIVQSSAPPAAARPAGEQPERTCSPLICQWQVRGGLLTSRWCSVQPSIFQFGGCDERGRRP